MNNQVEISVVMAVYKEPLSWISLAIESILKQSFKNFEFIIILDNPIDLVLTEFLKGYAKKDLRIKLLFNETNIGLTKSLNKGICISCGKYIARMDADDISESYRFQMQYDFMENNTQYVACGSNVLFIDENDKIVKLLKKPKKNSDINDAMIAESPIVHPTFFFKRNSGLLYNEYYIFAQDYDLIARLSSIGKLYNIQKPLLKYRKSSLQISSQKLKEQSAFGKKIRDAYVAQYIKTRDGSDFITDSPEALKYIQNKLTKFRSKSRKADSYIFYNLITSQDRSFKKKILVIIFQPFLKIDLRYRLRLLLSLFIN